MQDLGAVPPGDFGSLVRTLTDLILEIAVVSGLDFPGEYWDRVIKRKRADCFNVAKDCVIL